MHHLLPENLTPVSREVLALSAERGGMFFEIRNINGAYGLEVISWPEYQNDLNKLKQVFKLMESSQTFSDSKFRKEILPQIRELLLSTNLFSLLADSKIKLTARQSSSGLNSAEHILAGLENVVVDHLSPSLRMALRWMIMFHDVGKAIGAKVDFQLIYPVLQKHREDKNKPADSLNSFPDHQLNSAAIWEVIAYDLGITGQGPRFTELVSTLIRYHHIYPKLVVEAKKTKDGKSTLDLSKLQNIEEINLDNINEVARYLLLWATFNYADISTVPVNHKFWPENRQALLNWYEANKKQLSQETQSMFDKFKNQMPEFINPLELPHLEKYRDDISSLLTLVNNAMFGRRPIDLEHEEIRAIIQSTTNHVARYDGKKVYFGNKLAEVQKTTKKPAQITTPEELGAVSDWSNTILMLSGDSLDLFHFASEKKLKVVLGVLGGESKVRWLTIYSGSHTPWNGNENNVDSVVLFVQNKEHVKNIIRAAGLMGS